MCPENSDGTISVLVADIPEVDADQKGLFPRSKELVVKEIPVTQLKQQLESLRSDLAALVPPAEEEEGASELRLSELSVQVEITASGGVHLIGTAEVGATASLTLKFSR